MDKSYKDLFFKCVNESKQMHRRSNTTTIKNIHTSTNTHGVLIGTGGYQNCVPFKGLSLLVLFLPEYNKTSFGFRNPVSLIVSPSDFIVKFRSNNHSGVKKSRLI